MISFAHGGSGLTLAGVGTHDDVFSVPGGAVVVGGGGFRRGGRGEALVHRVDGGGEVAEGGALEQMAGQLDVGGDDVGLALHRGALDREVDLRLDAAEVALDLGVGLGAAREIGEALLEDAERALLAFAQGAGQSADLELGLELGDLAAHLVGCAVGAAVVEVMLRDEELEEDPLKPVERVGVRRDGEFVDLLVLVDLQDVAALGLEVGEGRALLRACVEAGQERGALDLGALLGDDFAARVDDVLEARVGGEQKEIGGLEPGAERPERGLAEAEQRECGEGDDVEGNAAQVRHIHLRPEASRR